MDINLFFSQLRQHYMLQDGIVIGVYCFTPDNKKAVPGLLVVTQASSRQLIFDSERWHPKPGIQASDFSSHIAHTKVIYLQPSPARNGEDLPQVCFDSLEPVAGSEVLFTPDMMPKFDIWMRADNPD